MTQDNGTTAMPDAQAFAQEAQERLQELGKSLNAGVEQARMTIAKQLRELIQRVRQETAEKPLDAAVQEQVNRVTTRIDDMATYLETHKVEDIRKQVTHTVQENTFWAILIALIVGFVIGVLVSRD